MNQEALRKQYFLLFAQLQKQCRPTLWSQGVASVRANRVSFVEERGGEFCFRVTRTDRPFAAQVSVWVEEEDYYCDCGEGGSEEDLCVHLAAALIFHKNSWQKNESQASLTSQLGGKAPEDTHASTSSNTSEPLTPRKPQPEVTTERLTLQLEYRLQRKGDHQLFLSRWWVLLRQPETLEVRADHQPLPSTPHEQQQQQPVLGSLVAWVGGIQSGRIAPRAEGPWKGLRDVGQWMTSQDWAMDAWITSGMQMASQGMQRQVQAQEVCVSGTLTRGFWQIFSQLRLVTYEGRRVAPQAQVWQARAWLRDEPLDGGGGGGGSNRSRARAVRRFRLRIEAAPAGSERLGQSLALQHERLIFLETKKAVGLRSAAPEKEQDKGQETPYETAATQGPGILISRQDLRVWVTERLPALQSKMTVVIETQAWPRFSQARSQMVLFLQAHQRGAGGEPQLQVTPQWELEPDGPGDFKIHRAQDLQPWVVRLKEELHLTLGQSLTLVGEAAVSFLHGAAAAWQWRGSGAEAFQVAGSVQLSLVPQRTPQTASGKGDVGVDEQSSGFQVKVGVAARGSGEARSSWFLEEAAAGLSVGEVLRAWEHGARWISLPSGAWAALPEESLQGYVNVLRRMLEGRKDSVGVIPHYFIPQLLETLGVGGWGGGLGEQSQSQQALQSTRLEPWPSFADLPAAHLPADLQAEPRGYQLQCVAWLAFLRGKGAGALLADDMGLGKTLQVLCALQGRTLIVCPTSVLPAWVLQMQDFRPHLRFAIYGGAGRSLAETDQAEVVLTSYGVLRLDVAVLREPLWDAVVLDESQMIKNPDSQVARAAFQLRGRFRVALSGTPIENRLEDLWSQFHFLNPGLLGSQAEFKARFGGEVAPQPGSSGGGSGLPTLQRLIAPFFLRRLKSQVLTELPPRIEKVLYSQLNDAERTSYEALLASTRSQVLAQLADGAQKKVSLFSILELLLRLRQACCHLALLPGQQQQGGRVGGGIASSAPSSSKLDLLMETLENSLQAGHRALIFSQWTSYLDLIEVRLNASQVSYLRLDGSSKDRAGLVGAFQKPNGPSVMLLSLKAGGVGITLTAADHLFLMDPWWNPAVQNQAADRAHRIGQKRSVLVHQMIAANTIEEKILTLQRSKSTLAQAILQGEEREVAGAASQSGLISQQEILELLAD